MTRVRLYGLGIDLPGPMAGTIAIAAESPADVEVRVDAPPASPTAEELYRSPGAEETVPTLVASRRTDGALRLAFAEGARFTVAGDGRTVWCEWDAPLGEADAHTFLAGPVLGLALRAHGALALHASAVVIAGGAWAILGQGGAGKSTTAAACALAGLPVLSEDLLAVRASGERWMAAAGHHQLRLWDEGMHMIAPGESLPPLTAAWPKRAFDLAARGLPLASHDAPLRGVVVLAPRGDGAAPPLAERINGADAVIELVAHAYVNHLLPSEVLARELAAFAAIARSVPAWRLRAAAGPEGMRETVALLRGLADTLT